MATLDPTLNFWGVLFESKQIIKAHSRHFLALTVVFLFPLSFSLIIYPTFQTTLSQSQPKHIRILLSHPIQISNYSLQTLALPLIFTLYVSIFSLCAIGTITYSTYHGFYGRPVKLASAIKSLFYSFIPLAITTIFSQIVVFIICASFAVLVPQLVEILGFDVDYNSNYFLGFCVVVSVILLLLLVRLQVNWALACVIVVVESKWGFEPLRRSTYLMKGMRPVSLYLILFFGAVIGVSVWVCSGSFWGSFSDVWKCLSFVLQTVLGSSIVAMFLLQNLASNTVLYMYCKALRGELAGAIAEEFAGEYVSLPFDDAKVPHVVFVAQA